LCNLTLLDLVRLCLVCEELQLQGCSTYLMWQSLLKTILYFPSRFFFLLVKTWSFNLIHVWKRRHTLTKIVRKSLEKYRIFSPIFSKWELGKILCFFFLKISRDFCQCTLPKRPIDYIVFYEYYNYIIWMYNYLQIYFSQYLYTLVYAIYYGISYLFYIYLLPTVQWSRPCSWNWYIWLLSW